MVKIPPKWKKIPDEQRRRKKQEHKQIKAKKETVEEECIEARSS